MLRMDRCVCIAVFFRASSTHPAESWRRSAKLRTSHRSHPIAIQVKTAAAAAAVIAMSVVATAAAVTVAVEAAAADSSVVLHVFLGGGDQRSRNPSRGPFCRDALLYHIIIISLASANNRSKKGLFAPWRPFLRVSLRVACSQIRCYQLQQTCAHRLCETET